MKTAKKINFELTLRNDDSVIIKEYSSYDYYSNKPIYNFLEVSCEINRKTFKAYDFKYRVMRFENDTLANWYSREHAIQYGYASEKAIMQAEKMLKSHIKEMKNTIENGKNHPAYTAMLSIAKEEINHYQDDFYWHDTLTLANKNPNKFIWMVRNTGSHLIDSKNNWFNEVINYEVKNRESKYYYWNGTTLEDIDIDTVKYYYSKFTTTN